MPEKAKKRNGNSSLSPRITKEMETEVVSLAPSNGIAFRLPALQPDVSSVPRKTRQSVHGRIACPREMRAIAASEGILCDKQEKQWIRKKAALMKRRREKTKQELDLEAHQTSIDESLTNELKDSYDAMGFLARELTEVNDALENNKESIKKDTLKGLRKVVAGVLHTLRQDQIKTVLDSMKLSTSMKYENITQAASLSPRVLKKAEKREPVSREFHVCKGCKEGGLLPWLYLYPDHEVYRTGGGFDCVEFHLPVVVHSNKSLTKPKDPFDKPRGKLVDTSIHKLPERLPVHITKPVPFNFKREKQMHENLVKKQRGETVGNPTAIKKIEFGKRRPRTVPELDNSKKSKETRIVSEHLQKDAPLHSSLETITSSFKDKDSDFLNNTNSTNTSLLGWQPTGVSTDTDSGVVTGVSSSSDKRSSENIAANIKNTNRAMQFNELNNLHKRVTGLDSLASIKVTKQKTENEVLKAPKKLVVRKSMALTHPTKKDVKSIHNSSWLSKNDKLNHSTMKNAFGLRMKPLKTVARPKRSTSSVGSTKQEIGGSSSNTVTDISANFSSSLSLETTSQQDIVNDEYSDFTLTGSKVTGMKRYLKDERRVPRPKERKISKSTKRSGEVSNIKEDDDEMFKPNKSGRRRKKSKNETDKNGTTEVVIDIISSMISEHTTPDAFDAESLSRVSSCKQESRRGVRNEKANANVSGMDIDELTGPASTKRTIDITVTNTGSPAVTSSAAGLLDVAGMNTDVDSDDDDDDDEEFDEIDDFPEIEEGFQGKKIRKKMKRRRTLQFRTEPLSRYTVKRRSKDDFEFGAGMGDDDDDSNMLDYAARYCIISLEKLSKYENTFSSFASCGGEADEHGDEDVDIDLDFETEDQRMIMKEYEKLIYSMDVYQQKISESERKRAELKNERERTLSNISSLQLDEQKKRLLEKSVQAFSRKITTVDDRIKAFVSHVKNMIDKKRDIENKLRESTKDSEKVDKIIKNSDFLGRKFTKLKCLKIKVEELPDALRSFNPNFDDEDFRFINHVLKLPEKDSLDFKAFAVVSALTERVKLLDKSIKTLLKEVDLGTLERKLDKCKELYRLLSEEHQDGKRTVPLENLLVELQAGGLNRDHQRCVVDKLNHHGHGFVDFLDFVLYIPLFLMIHDQIVQKPFE